MNAKPLKVWLVDDDASIRWVLEKALKGGGMNAKSFEQADSAISALRTETPDELMTDIRMSGKSGLELLRTVHERNPGLPENTPLFPQAYAHTRGGQQPSWLPQLRPWIFSLFMVAAGYLLVAHFIWDRRSSEVTARLDELNNRLGASQSPSRTAAESPAADPKSGKIRR